MLQHGAGDADIEAGDAESLLVKASNKVLQEFLLTLLDGEEVYSGSSLLFAFVEVLFEHPLHLLEGGNRASRERLKSRLSIFSQLGGKRQSLDKV